MPSGADWRPRLAQSTEAEVAHTHNKHTNAQPKRMLIIFLLANALVLGPGFDSWRARASRQAGTMARARYEIRAARKYSLGESFRRLAPVAHKKKANASARTRYTFAPHFCIQRAQNKQTISLIILKRVINNQSILFIIRVIYSRALFVRVANNNELRGLRPKARPK